MTSATFRSLALSLPDVVESAHMDHPDFRVREKIFATIGPDGSWAMVKLTPDQQASFIRDEPEIFHPATGAWGRNGATIITLRKAKTATVRLALDIAWDNIAPKGLKGKNRFGSAG